MHLRAEIFEELNKQPTPAASYLSCLLGILGCVVQFDSFNICYPDVSFLLEVLSTPKAQEKEVSVSQSFIPTVSNAPQRTEEARLWHQSLPNIHFDVSFVHLNTLVRIKRGS